MTQDREKIKVSTDTLVGILIGPDKKKDAIHLAVIPCVAKESLDPGEHVTAHGVGAPTSTPTAPLVGIVDPFLQTGGKKGERFWLVINSNVKCDWCSFNRNSW
jgi:hypothetical protein